MIKNVTLGADPELFLEKDGEVVSAEGLIGGTKEEPKAISEEGHCIQEDNVMIEFNIPASKTAVEFRDNINFVKDYLSALATIQGGKLNFSASAELDTKYLQTDQAKLFGCDPDYSVHLKRQNTPPESTGSLRTCGGHIHVGYDNPSQEVSEKIIYAMDFVLGLESINLDPDDRRREMYGNAGCFRFKEYGVEYRTLSNFWITTNELMEWAFNSTLKAIELVNSGVIDLLIKDYAKAVKIVIDNNDKEAAKLLLKVVNKIIEKKLVTIEK
jgi:hypothetical protein